MSVFYAIEENLTNIVRSWHADGDGYRKIINIFTSYKDAKSEFLKLIKDYIDYYVEGYNIINYDIIELKIGLELSKCKIISKKKTVLTDFSVKSYDYLLSLEEYNKEEIPSNCYKMIVDYLDEDYIPLINQINLMKVPKLYVVRHDSVGKPYDIIFFKDSQLEKAKKYVNNITRECNDECERWYFGNMEIELYEDDIRTEIYSTFPEKLEEESARIIWKLLKRCERIRKEKMYNLTMQIESHPKFGYRIQEDIEEMNKEGVYFDEEK